MKENEVVIIETKEEVDEIGERSCRLIVKFSQKEKKKNRDICQKIEDKYNSRFNNQYFPKGCKEVPVNQLGINEGELREKVLKEYEEEFKNKK